MLMDNGQSLQPQLNPFSGITAGVGNAVPETNPLPSQDNLNLNGFGPERDNGKLGNSVLSASETPLTMPPDEKQLGEIVTIPTPPLMGPAVKPVESIPSSGHEDAGTLAPAIADQLSKGEVDGNVIGYFDKMAGESSPEDLNNLVGEARRVMNGLKEPK